MYAEDLLRKTVLGGDSAVQIGDKFNLRGDHISDALQKAQELSQEQIENLNKLVKGIGQKAWKETLNYSSVFNPDNDFAKGILEQAKEQAAEAAKTETAKLGKQAATEAVRQAAGEIGAKTSQAAQSWFREKVVIWGLLGGAGAVGLGLALKKIAQRRGTPEERATRKEEKKLAKKLHESGSRPEVINTAIQLQEEFGRRFPYAEYGLVMGAPASGITESQARDGIRKLMNVLDSIAPPLHFKNAIIRIGMGLVRYNPNPERFEFNAEIQVDPLVTEGEIRTRLIQAAKEINQSESSEPKL